MDPKGITFLGDEQSSPHFMRYSGLTGAAINSMLFNDFLGAAVQIISRNLMQHDSNRGSQYDPEMNRLVKKGASLKKNDLFLRCVDPSGNPSEQKHSWKVSNIEYATALETSDLQLGEEYEIYDTKKKITYSLDGVRFWKGQLFVLSNGHGCVLLYAMLHLSGYDVSMDDEEAPTAGQQVPRPS